MNGVCNVRIKNSCLIMAFYMAMIASGCWFYSFKGTLPPHIKSIAIPLFSDQTAEFNIQQVVTDQIRVGFIRENILKLVEEDNAHSIFHPGYCRSQSLAELI